MSHPIQRRSIKSEARLFVREGRISPLGFTAAYLGILLVMDLLVTFLLTGVFPTILSSLFAMVLGAGMILFCMGLRRREEMPFVTLFDGFTFVGKIIWLNVLRGLFISSAALAGTVLASMAVSFLGRFLMGDGFLDTVLQYSQAMIAAETLTPELLPAVLGSLALMAVGSIPAIISAYRYRFALYNLCHLPSLTATECLRMSQLQTKGHKGRLFLLDLSFLGWFCLSLLTAGILLIWVTPYYYCADLGCFDICCQLSGVRPVEYEADESIPPDNFF